MFESSGVSVSQKHCLVLVFKTIDTWYSTAFNFVFVVIIIINWVLNSFCHSMKWFQYDIFWISYWKWNDYWRDGMMSSWVLSLTFMYVHLHHLTGWLFMTNMCITVSIKLFTVLLILYLSISQSRANNNTQ